MASNTNYGFWSDHLILYLKRIVSSETINKITRKDYLYLEEKIPIFFLGCYLSQPGAELLDAGLELCPVLDVLTELGALGLDLLVQLVQLVPHVLEPLDELLGVGRNLFTRLREDFCLLRFLEASFSLKKRQKKLI